MLKLTNTLEKKVILSLLFVSMASILALYSALQLSVYSAFDQMEQQESDKNQTRAKNIVGTQFEELSLINREYSEWDETYSFLKNNENSLSGLTRLFRTLTMGTIPLKVSLPFSPTLIGSQNGVGISLETQVIQSQITTLSIDCLQ